MSSTPADVLIVGAGPSGLAVATGLARQAYTTIVFDAGDYRNARAEYMHNVPGFDHTPPEFFRNEVKNDISRRYDTVTFENVNVVEIRKARLRLPNAERGPVHGQERRHAGQNKRNEEDAEESQDSFEVLDSKGRVWEGRKVVLASGVTDEMLPIEGYAQCWAKGIYHCLFCDGYEWRGLYSNAGVLAIDDCAPPDTVKHLARSARRLVERITIYTDGDKALGEQITGHVEDVDAVRIESGTIMKFEKVQEQSAKAEGFKEAVMKVHLEDGRTITEGFIVHKPKTRLNNLRLITQLGIEVNAQGDIQANESGETNIPGILAVGDCALPTKTVIQAMASGAAAAAKLTCLFA
ncbi:thioredoxin reductase [Penicillium chrysogenum]|uniref:Thioredoxin reductase n=1 Tax=Penicillium chrysogenum TaxID=5076 RepID=A0ABQ8WEI9_PENCH|nr:thioredoxin reductase [Penicillium chrysogenum]KAJ5244899.1 thioredoxin reductase [Penicillium chrysogenum]KAJ5264704.1 thioredoxin reductase [Penicillium chrysogenum]KAJ5849246.1 thioredoxin reductase [Penicillium rubens]